LNDFLDQDLAILEPFSKADGRAWNNQGVAPLGCVMQFRIFCWDPERLAVVAVTQTSAERWIFTAMTNNCVYGGVHLLSGNREFSVQTLRDGMTRIDARGANRVTACAILGEAAVLDFEDRVWLGWQRRVHDFVNANGGKAHLVGRTRHLPSFESLRSSRQFTR
jgi:hypothetical protein